MMASDPSRIGPYRLEDRLGAGGMGQVYRAWDERLERWVAVKLIRPEAAGDERARERFRREARAAARLSHAAIVQIHDVVLTDAADAIVMELVEGTPLSSLIARGPLELAPALRLAAQIAEGLAAAHDRGVVHRDLKPENVMVDAGGRARILDFGLAKQLGGETSLTLDHMVVGTYRAMSPEQARGLEVDARSDLFSFGTLLYEMLAGRSPFPGAAPLETLTRICAARQTPLREVRPEVPAGLSELVDRLLEKDPARRPQSAGEVAWTLAGLAGPPSSSADSATRIERPPLAPLPPAAPGSAGSRGTYSSFGKGRRRALLPALLAVLLAAGTLAVLWRAGRPARLQVAVPRPAGVAADAGEAVELMAAGLRGALLRGLLSFEGVSPLAPEQVDTVSGSPVEVARAVASDELVTARLDCGADSCSVALQRILGADGSLLWTQSFEAPLQDPYLVAEAVENLLQQAYSDRPLRQGVARLEVRGEDYKEHLRLRRAFERAELPLDELLARTEAIRARSPRFTEADLLMSDVLRYRFQAQREPADLERALAVLDRARAAAPADPRPLFRLFEVALAGGRLGLAEETLRELEASQPADPEVAIRRARLLELRGAPDRALPLMREAVRRRPSVPGLLRLADMEFRLGEGEAARAHAEEALALSPEHYQAASLLAQTELQYGDPRRAAEIYDRLVRRAPHLAELANLGFAWLQMGRYPEAEARFRQALELSPRNSLIALNLADAVLLQGRDGEGRALYTRVLELVEQDPAASDWQMLSTRAQALAHLGRRREAVDAAQSMLVAARQNPQAAYEASLVYTLVGDRSSALVNAEKALAGGVEPRLFDNPWFDPLRRSPELQTLLRR
jgi:tetratricopeptide (TPR) repeat protein/tRNA A-37 threonylcarbamoyl transferase component Bud32